MTALDTLDPRSAALVWLAVRARPELRPLVHALWTGDEPAVLPALVAFPATPRVLGGAVARRIAEACRLPHLLDQHPGDLRLLARAARLVVRMGSASEDSTDLLGYRDARHVYETVVRRADLLPPTLDHAATLLSLALDLSSGTGVLLDWPPGLRSQLLASLGQLLDEPRWASAATTAGDATREQHRRAAWIHRTGRRPFTPSPEPDTFRVAVVAGDPADGVALQARVLLDGRPVVPAAFGRGPANSPENLLDGCQLHATPQPRDVQLAEAACTEGCCGALYVTVRRDGDHVVWDNWRQTQPGSRPASLSPARRFDAATYDTEIARAGTDRSWSWPARTLARLLTAELTAHPSLLSRWDARRGWISTGHEDPDTVDVTFLYVPGLGTGNPERPDSPLQFRWVLADDGTPPEAQAAAAVRRLAEQDPRTYAQLCGGSPRRARELGYAWPGTA